MHRHASTRFVPRQARDEEAQREDACCVSLGLILSLTKDEAIPPDFDGPQPDAFLSLYPPVAET